MFFTSVDSILKDIDAEIIFKLRLSKVSSHINFKMVHKLYTGVGRFSILGGGVAKHLSIDRIIGGHVRPQAIFKIIGGGGGGGVVRPCCSYAYEISYNERLYIYRASLTTIISMVRV